MSKVMFVSDCSFAIDWLFNLQFYTTYSFLYQRPYFDLVLAKTKLNTEGIKVPPKQFQKVSTHLKEFKITNEEIIPDLCLFQQVFVHQYKSYKIKNLQKFSHDNLSDIKEANRLYEIINFSHIQTYDPTYEIPKNIEKVQLKVFTKDGKKPKIFNFLSEKYIKRLISSALEEYSTSYRKIFENTDGEKLTEDFFNLHGKPSNKKDTLLKIIQHRATILINVFLRQRLLLGMTENIRTITNEAAYFIGTILNDIKLMDHTEEEFTKDKLLQESYGSYEKYLIQKVKSYLSVGKK